MEQLDLFHQRSVGDWVNLETVWDHIYEQANKRCKDLESTRRLIEDYNFLGLLGECVLGEELGLAPDLCVYRGGDCGIDFPLTDVKATAGGKHRLADPHLIVDAHKLHAGASYFSLVLIKPETRSARLAGWASPAQLEPHPHNFGNGPTYALRSSQLNHGLPAEVTAAAAKLRNGHWWTVNEIAC